MGDAVFSLSLSLSVHQENTYLLGVCGIKLSTLVTKVGTFTITSSSSGIRMSLIASSSLKYLDHGVYRKGEEREKRTRVTYK